VALTLLLVASPAGARRRPPESIPECSHDLAARARAIVTHLGGCRVRTSRVRGLLGGLGEAGPGWSLALATERGIRELRRRGCPTAVVCTSGNELAALQQSVPPEELASLLDAVKERARPPLPPGAHPGPILPWE
jgi:hypothetical protein